MFCQKKGKRGHTHNAERMVELVEPAVVTAGAEDEEVCGRQRL